MTCVACGCKDIESGEHRCPRCGRRLDRPEPRTIERPVATPVISVPPPPPPVPPVLPPLVPPAGRGGPAAALAPEWKQEVSDRLEQFRHKRAQRRPQEPDLLSVEEKSEEVPRPDPSQKILAFEDFAAERIEPLIIEPPKSSPPEWKKDGWRELQEKRELRENKDEPPPAHRSYTPAAAPQPAQARKVLPPSEAAFEPDEIPYDDFVPYPVAPIALRGIAGALDCSVALVAVGVFFFTFHLMGGSVHLNQKAGAGTGLAAAAVLAFYFFLYVAYVCETPGLQWMRLRVLDYDGGPPRCGQRLMRAVGMLMSAAALGLGYLWALADEEGLTWHDRMSKTFVALEPGSEQRLRRAARNSG